MDLLEYKDVVRIKEEPPSDELVINTPKVTNELKSETLNHTLVKEEAQIKLEPLELVEEEVDIKPDITHKFTEEKIYKCTFCTYTTTLDYILQIHEVSHRKENFDCTFCAYKTSTKKEFYKHLDIHLDDNLFKCNKCEYQTVNKVVFIKHANLHLGELPFSCTNCDYKSATKRGLQRHKNIHAGENPSFDCTECNYKFPTERGLQRHKTSHNREKYFKCKYCTYQTDSKVWFQKHTRIHTQDETDWELFFQKHVQDENKTIWTSDLQQDMKNHTEEPSVSSE